MDLSLTSRERSIENMDLESDMGVGDGDGMSAVEPFSRNHDHGGSKEYCSARAASAAAPPQRRVSTKSRSAPSSRLLPLWQRIFSLRRSAGGKKKSRRKHESTSSHSAEDVGATEGRGAGGDPTPGRGAGGDSTERLDRVAILSTIETGGGTPAAGVEPKKDWKSAATASLSSGTSLADKLSTRESRFLEEADGGTASLSAADTDHDDDDAADAADAVDAVDAALRSPGAVDGKTAECPLCLTVKPLSFFPQISTCSHRSCLICIKHYLRIEISEARTNICCPECIELFHPTDIQRILQDEKLMSKFEDFTLRRHLANEPDCRWCPAPDCGYAVIATGCASCPRIHCQREGCNIYFCYHCKQEWHPETTCDEARNLRRTSPGMAAMLGSLSENRRAPGGKRRNWGNDPGPLYRSMFPLERAPSVSSGSSLAGNDIKSCPRCTASIIKMDDGSCNHITCAVCGAEFCWLCMREISDLHYLSPSGCTFWGKKPWSRKKKILWQLGTLVGAPVGIGLVAGIAVPAIIIGVPVWVGRKIFARYSSLPRHKRNLHVVGGVSASVLISPLLATLAVGVGVPILLAYVYGVVPISLCRAGGCGVSTSATGVRFDFDDDQDVITVNNSAAIPDNQSADVSHVGTIGNPSIGDDSAVLLPSHQGDDDSQVAGFQLGGSVGDALAALDAESRRQRTADAGTGGSALRHRDTSQGESASTTGVLSGLVGRSGHVGASFGGLSALGDSASYADSILADTVSASSAPGAAAAQQGLPPAQAFHVNRLEVLADVSASIISGMSSTGTTAAMGATGGAKQATSGGGSGGKRASVSSSAGSTSFTFACDSKSATVSFQSDGEASTRALAGSILSRNDRDRDSGLGTPQPGQMEVQSDIQTNPSISSYRVGNGSLTSCSNNNSRRGSLGSALAPEEPLHAHCALVPANDQDRASEPKPTNFVVEVVECGPVNLAYPKPETQPRSDDTNSLSANTLSFFGANTLSPPGANTLSSPDVNTLSPENSDAPGQVTPSATRTQASPDALASTTRSSVASVVSAASSTSSTQSQYSNVHVACSAQTAQSSGSISQTHALAVNRSVSFQVDEAGTATHSLQGAATSWRVDVTETGACHVTHVTDGDASTPSLPCTLYQQSRNSEALGQDASKGEQDSTALSPVECDKPRTQKNPQSD